MFTLLDKGIPELRVLNVLPPNSELYIPEGRISAEDLEWHGKRRLGLYGLSVVFTMRPDGDALIEVLASKIPELRKGMVFPVGRA